MKRLLASLFATLFVVIHFGLKPANSDPPVVDVPPTSLSPLMRMKLEKSKEILEGLTIEDLRKDCEERARAETAEHGNGLERAANRRVRRPES